MHKYNYRAILSIRKRLGLSLSGMSEKLGTHDLRMVEYESGMINPTVDDFLKLWDMANEEEKNELINAP